MHYLSVGDSGVFLVSGGKVQMLNRPHVYANVLDQAVARGALSAEQAAIHPERDSLTSFVGIPTLHEIDRETEPRALSSGDTILLASDGLFKTLEIAEIQGCLTGPPQSWPSVLVERTIAKSVPAQDNVTVLSVTPAGDAAPEWVPFSPGSVFDAAPAREAESSSLLKVPAWRGKRWPWILAALVVVGDAALIAWIYFFR